MDLSLIPFSDARASLSGYPEIISQEEMVMLGRRATLFTVSLRENGRVSVLREGRVL